MLKTIQKMGEAVIDRSWTIITLTLSAILVAAAGPTYLLSSVLP